MPDQVQHRREGAISVMYIPGGADHRLGPLLDAGCCRAISAALAEARDAQAVLIMSQGAGFGWGPEPARLPDAGEAEALAALCSELDRFPVPVVAWLRGPALGAGMELALAAHWRIAAPDARLGMPDILLGLPPGAGTTQRLPRVAGTEAALRILLSGQALDARAALSLGIADAIAGDEDAALAFARGLAGQPPRPSNARQDRLDPKAGEAAVTSARAALRDPVQPALRAVIDCVEAAFLLPGSAGLSYERVAYEDCLQTEAAQGLRHAALGDQRAARLLDAAAQGAPQPRHLLLAGAPPALAEAALTTGLRVTLYNSDKDRVLAELHAVAARLDEALARGRLEEDEFAEVWTRLSATTEAGTSAADAILFGTARDAALAVGLPPDADRFCLEPAGEGVMTLVPLPNAANPRLLEVPAGPPRAVAAGFALARALGRGALPASPSGSAAARVARVAQEAAADLITASRDAAAVEQALRAEGLPPALARPAQRPGRGNSVPVWAGVLATMAAAGAEALTRDPALRPWMIDHALVQGFGFPRWRGGPLAAADHHGLGRLVAMLDRMGQAPPTLLLRLVAEERGFDSLNRGPGLRPVGAVTSG